MTEPLELTYLPDTLASESRPTMRFVSREDIYLRGGSGQRVLGYILPRGLPSGPDVVVESAVLGLWPIASAASATIHLRRCTQAWGSGSLTFDNAPNIAGIQTTRTGTLVRGQRVDFDVTALVQAWCTGALPNCGVRLETTATTARSFHSANAQNRDTWPVLIVTFSTKPDVPQGFVLTGGAQCSVARPNVPWLYADDAGSPMAAYQLQANPTDAFTTPAYDSGEVASGEPLHPWHTDLVDGQSVWYRVRHRSQSGRWSDWSDAHEFGRTVKSALTVTAPSGVVPDYTPTSTRTFAGVQTGYRVRYLRGSTVVADSRDLPGDAASWAPSTNLRVPLGVELTARWDVVDDVDRVATPGDPVETTAASGPFELGPAEVITPVSGLAAAVEGEGPIVGVSWSYPSTPDGFVVEQRVAEGEWRTWRLDAGDVSQGGNAFLFRDVTAPAWRMLTYRVRAVVNGEMGEATVEVQTSYDASAIFLIDPDDPDWTIALGGTDPGDWLMPEDSTVHRVIGSDRAIIVHEGTGGYEGSIGGVLRSQAERDRSWRIKRQPTKVWRLALSDMNFPVALRMAVPSPQGEPMPRYDFEVEFFQQGENMWLVEDDD